MVKDTPWNVLHFDSVLDTKIRKISGLTLTIRKRFADQTQHLSVLFLTCLTGKANLTLQITADDLDDFLEALEESDDGDAEGLLKALTPLAGTEQPLVVCVLTSDEKPESVPEVLSQIINDLNAENSTTWY